MPNPLTALYRVISKGLSGAKAPLASDVNQFVDLFNANLDAGQLTLAPQISAPSTTGVTAAASTGSALGVGAYLYKLTFVTGNLQADNTYTVSGETSGSATVTATTTSGNQNVTISGLPPVSSWPSTAIGINIYRTAINGVDGSQKLVGSIYTNYARTSSQTSYIDSVTDASLGKAIPTLNTTGTSIAGINALAHSNAISALYHFEGNVLSTRGLAATFTRASAANDPTTLFTQPNNSPRFASGKYGRGVFIEEGTTNLVMNSDFETITGTAQVFADPLTSYTGSTAAPWTVQLGSFTFGASGATSGASGATMMAGNNAWKALTGSGGQNLSLFTQATFTMPATVPTNIAMQLMLSQSTANQNNIYELYSNGSTLALAKKVNGTYTTLTSVTQILSVSTAYTATLSIDKNGLLTAKLYSGTGTGGTLLQTLTATDTSLSGGFLVGVGGDAGVVISGVSVNAPWADGWTIGGDARVAWALTSAAISGGYSVSAKGVATGVQGYIASNTFSYSATTYTLSGYVSTSGVGSSGGAYIRASTNVGVSSSTLSGTTTATRLQVQNTATASGTNNCALLMLNDVGTATFDAIQLESKSYATSYQRNDSTTQTATRAAETLTIPASVLNASAGTISVWAYENGEQSTAFIFDTDGSRMLIDRLGGGSPYYQAFVNGNNIGLQITAPPIGLHHWVLSWNGTIVKLYLDGVLKGTASVVGGVSFANTTKIYAGSSYTGSYQLNGTPDELAIFNRALSDAEVYSLYASTQPLIDALDDSFAPDVRSYSQYASSPDTNDIYQTVKYNRRDGTLYMQSTLSNPDANGNYQTATVNHYDSTGAVLLWTDTWTMTYDTYGRITSKVQS